MSAIKWIWLSEGCGAGSTDVFSLVSRTSNIDDIYKMDYETYISFGVSERTAERLCDKSLEEAYSISQWCTRNSVGILTFGDEKFPMTLRSLKNPPCVLYYLGALPNFNEALLISVVGTRKMSEYGMKSAYKIAYELAGAGAVIVSGMALGIDGVAACASLAAGGRTVAVLGCGIDVVYPKEHEKLKGIIAERGAVITEYSPSTKPHGYHFPVRNRIISGLSVGTLVVDAPEGSGALITAKNAIIQGKDLYAVPGNIDGQNTQGTNALIRDGATAVLSGRDIVKNYSYLYRATVNLQKLAAAESSSDFDPSCLLSMGVSMRTSVPAREEMQNDRMHAENETLNTHIRKFEGFTSKEKKKTEKKAKATPAPKQKTAEGVGDDSQKALEALSERQRAIFSEMPMDKPVTVDFFVNMGFSMGEVMATLTVLEIRGLVSSLPGALYIRK